MPKRVGYRPKMRGGLSGGGLGGHRQKKLTLNQNKYPANSELPHTGPETKTPPAAPFLMSTVIPNQLKPSDGAANHLTSPPQTKWKNVLLF